jgi:hypothetical protein
MYRMQILILLARIGKKKTIWYLSYQRGPYHFTNQPSRLAVEGKIICTERPNIYAHTQNAAKL